MITEAMEQMKEVQRIISMKFRNVDKNVYEETTLKET